MIERFLTISIQYPSIPGCCRPERQAASRMVQGAASGSGKALDSAASAMLFARREHDVMERRLVAILCADVAGYSRMMGIDEAGTHAAFKAHRGAIHPIILNHAGRIVKHTGDGFLLEFANAGSA